MSVPEPPRATARLQFHRDFTLDDARATVPYYAELGISHLYASPLLAAREGSMHGYDVTDPRRVNPALGGLDALRRLVTELRRHGMGLILDIVPNHMAASVENPWWHDVLERGRDSRYAHYFDIDWNAPDADLRGCVLLPTLPREADAMLREGELRLASDAAEGRLRIVAGEQSFPLAARSYGRVLADEPALAAIAERFERAEDDEAFDAARAKLREQAQQAQQAGLAEALSRLVARYAGNDDASHERMRALLAEQPYRLVPWRQAWRRINWRRFFDVNDLVALRPDREDVFEATHGFVLQLYAEGLIDGLRIDHIDGLLDPRGYCRRLRDRLDALAARRPPDAPRGRAYLVVEKILASDESLPDDWPVDGTTGYEFMAQAGGVLHDPRGERVLDALWRRCPGAEPYADQVLAARRQMTLENFAADLDATARALQELADASADAPDPAALRAALVELIVHLEVYRTYAQPGVASATDARWLARAADRALRDRPPRARQAMAWLQARLAGGGPEATRQAVARVIARFQRITPPIAAKAVEDTVFYRYGRLLSRNEVGAEPEPLALSPEEFHAACLQRRRDWPHTLLATATHDHKRGEDARARLAVLSEVASRWADEVAAWREINATHRGRVEGIGEAPDAADELILYQTLVAAWPLALGISSGGPASDAGSTTAMEFDPLALRDFGERVAQWQRKALREAKRHSSWIKPNDDYESACERFLQSILEPGASSMFLDRLSSFVRSIAVAGAINGLSQTLLRLATPGVPDLYQGTEFWDHSLVDPDNRRPVDYAARRAGLQDERDWPALMREWHDGRLKQRCLQSLLQARRRFPSLFAEGDYRPRRARGPAADHVLAFERHRGPEALMAVSVRLPQALLGPDPREVRIEPQAWDETELDVAAGRWRDLLTDTVRTVEAPVRLRDLLDALPLTLWVREG